VSGAIHNPRQLEQLAMPEPSWAVRSQAFTANSKAVRSLAKLIPDRRKYRRVPIRVLGRFMREDKEEYPCQVVNMSAGGMAMLSPAQSFDGERIVAYLDNFGRIEGIVIRCIDGVMAVRIVASQYKREKITNLLTWLINRETLGLTEERKHERVVPVIRCPSLFCRMATCSTAGSSTCR
jgi:hypothetical protein